MGTQFELNLKPIELDISLQKIPVLSLATFLSSVRSQNHNTKEPCREWVTQKCYKTSVLSNSCLFEQVNFLLG